MFWLRKGKPVADVIRSIGVTHYCWKHTVTLVEEFEAFIQRLGPASLGSHSV